MTANERTTWSLSTWVREQRERTGPGFALQVFPIDTKEDPAPHLLAAARLAEALGFDAFFFGDHPAWGLECWVHMAFARPLQTVLATHLTGWLILAEDRLALQTKVQRLVPQGLERRFSGPWRGFAQAYTPGEAVDYFRALAAAGIDYFIAGLLDATDTETIRLLAEEVVPHVRNGAGSY